MASDSLEAWLRRWVAAVLWATGALLNERGDPALSRLRGSLSQEAVPDPAAFERANYMRTLLSWSTPLQ